MRLVTLYKDSGSGDGGCPSVHLDLDSGRVIVQGPLADQATLDRLPDVLPGEHAVVFDTPEVLLNATAALRARTGDVR